MVIYAFLFSALCFVLSCLGASIVFFFKKNSKKVDIFLHSFAAGVMIASGIFSLIIPAIDYCKELGLIDYIVLPTCFIIAMIMLYFLDLFSKEEAGKINKKILSIGIMLHNIPEGMCIGFAFASAMYLGTQNAFMSAIMIAVGIGIQNIPEGSAVSFPLYSSGISKKKSFFISALVAIVEIPSALIAFAVGSNLISILPFMLAFSGATMIAVACADLMPESVSINKRWSIVFLFLGFVVMMFLDLALG